MKFSRQEYWSGFLFPSPGDLPDLGIEFWVSCIAGRFFSVWATREAQMGFLGHVVLSKLIKNTVCLSILLPYVSLPCPPTCLFPTARMNRTRWKDSATPTPSLSGTHGKERILDKNSQVYLFSFLFPILGHNPNDTIWIPTDILQESEELNILHLACPGYQVLFLKGQKSFNRTSLFDNTLFSRFTKATFPLVSLWGHFDRTLDFSE